MSATDKPNYARLQPSPDNLAVALAYLAKHPGRKLFPCVGSKARPAFKDNLNLASNDPEQLKRWQREHGQRGSIMWACSPRVCEPPIFPLDADLQKPGAKDALDKLVREIGTDDFGASILDTETNKTPSGGLHLIFQGEHKFSQSRLGVGLDVPNYFMIPGQARADGKRYTVVKDVQAMPAPAALQLRVKPPLPERTRTFTADAVPLDLFKKMLAATPYTGGPDGLDDRHSYGGWLNFLMAAHEAAGGEEWGYLDAVIDWCLADPSPDWTHPTSAELIERKWQSFNAEANSAMTRGSWFAVLQSFKRDDLVRDASAAEDFEAMRADPSDFEAPANDNDAEPIAPDEPQQPFPEPVSFKDLLRTKWPMPEFIVEDLVMKGVPNTFNADGGTGKTTVSTQFGVAVAAGLPIFGKATMQAPVLLVLSEDGEGITQARCEAEVTELAKDAKFEPNELPITTWCLPGADVVLAKIDDHGNIKRMPFFKRLDERMAKVGCGCFVVLDSLVDVVQMQMKDPAPANAFFKRLLTGLCIKHDATILVLAHPSKASMQDGTWSHGSLAFKNAVRHGIAMKIIEGQTYRELWSLKHNYTDENRMRLYFEYPIFTLTPPSASDNPEVRRDAAILEFIVRTIREGKMRVTNTNQSGGYTPRAIADALNAGGMVGQVHWKHARSVMLKAEVDGVIKYVKAWGKIEAHYEWLGDPTTPLDSDDGGGDAADDFGEG